METPFNKDRIYYQVFVTEPGVEQFRFDEYVYPPADEIFEINIKNIFGARARVFIDKEGNLIGNSGISGGPPIFDSFEKAKKYIINWWELQKKILRTKLSALSRELEEADNRINEIKSW